MSNEAELKEALEKKEKEMNEVLTTFSEIKNAYETVNVQLQNKDLEIQTLKSNLEMKETQINTISGIIKTKDELIKSLQDTLKMKEEQIESLKQSSSAKVKEMETLKNSSVDNSEIEEKNKKIEDLENEIKLLNLDLKANDEEVSELNKKIEELSSNNDSTNDGIVSSNPNREKIIEFMVSMIDRSLHNLNITTPTIKDLSELQLYDVKSTVNIKASCAIDVNSLEDQELLEEFNALDTIS